jgi:hypothetical protein
VSVGTCRFDQLAEVKLGVKTFLNEFFYVDADRIKQFGIEKQFLDPVFRTGDLKRDRFQQKVTQTKLQIFLCSKDVKQLVGTGAAKYIQWAATQRHKGKKGEGPGGLWKDTPAVKPAQRVWYQNQAMPPPARIVLLKAFDDTFAPLILSKPIRVDQRFNQVNAQAGVDEDLVIGLLCSMWFVATLETFGRTALGAGALEMPTEALRGLPVPDVRKLSAKEAAAWKAALKKLLAGKRLPVGEMIKNEAQRELDELVLTTLGLAPTRVDELYADTIRMTRIRELLAAGRGTIRREQFESDLDDVADNIGAQLKPLVQGRRFPEDFTALAAKTENLNLGTARLEIRSEMMIGQRTLEISSGESEVFRRDLPQPVAEVILRALQFGQRSFSFPIDEAEADAALTSLDQLVAEIETHLSDLAARAESGAQADLRRRVEIDINFPTAVLATPFPPVYTADYEPLT